MTQQHDLKSPECSSISDELLTWISGYSVHEAHLYATWWTWVWDSAASYKPPPASWNRTQLGSFMRFPLLGPPASQPCWSNPTQMENYKIFPSEEMISEYLFSVLNTLMVFRLYEFIWISLYVNQIAWNFNKVIVHIFEWNVPFTGSLLGHDQGEIGHIYSYKLKTRNRNRIFMGRSYVKTLCWIGPSKETNSPNKNFTFCETCSR